MSQDRFPLSSQRSEVTVTVTSVGAVATPGTMNGTTRRRITATPRAPGTPPRCAGEPATDGRCTSWENSVTTQVSDSENATYVWKARKWRIQRLGKVGKRHQIDMTFNALFYRNILLCPLIPLLRNKNLLAKGFVYSSVILTGCWSYNVNSWGTHYWSRRTMKFKMGPKYWKK